MPNTAFQPRHTFVGDAHRASLHSGIPEDIRQKLEWVYPRLPESGLPAKLSISEIKRLYQFERPDEHALVFEPPAHAWPAFLGQGGGVTGARLGTLIHTVMERLDIHTHTDFNSISALVEQLAQKNILSREEANAVPIHKIAAFARSDLAARMRKAAALKKETPFVMGLRPAEIYSAKQLEAAGLTHSDATILVHGVVDCYFIETNEDGADEVVLVDYKSDRETDARTLSARYVVQLRLYKKALERSLGLPVKACLLYLFATGDVLTINA